MKQDELKIKGMHLEASPEIFKNAALLRNTMTKPEKMLCEYFRRKPFGFKFRRQHPISIYILDFYCHRARLSVEIDGEYHFTKEQKEKDLQRTEYLNCIGIKEIKFLKMWM